MVTFGGPPASDASRSLPPVTICLTPPDGTGAANPNDEIFPNPPPGLLRFMAVRVKFKRASFTALVPRLRVWLRLACWARLWLSPGKPGTFALGYGCPTWESSR